MARVSYDEIYEFKGHQNSVNAAAFSPDGRYLATGGDDYLLFIFDPFTGEVVHKLEGQAPVTAICWDPHEAGRLFVGYGTGRVLVAQSNSTPLSAHYLPRSTYDDPVEDLVCDIFKGVHRILICAGSRVELWKEMEESRWVETCLEPPNFIVAHARQSSSADVVARSGHLVNDGGLAVITYLNHGIVCWSIASRASFQWHLLPRTARLGRSAISSDGKLLAASNLYDGFDLYSLETRKHVVTCISQITLNIPLPVLMTDDGTELITGTPCGSLHIFDPTTGDKKAVVDHSDDIVQALAYCNLNGARLLATGTSERGDATLVKVWRRELPVSNAESGEHLVTVHHVVWYLCCVLVAKTCGMAARLAVDNLELLLRLLGHTGRKYLFRDKKVLSIALTVFFLIISVGLFHDETEESTGLGIWQEPSSHHGIWNSLSGDAIKILLRLARHASKGSRATGAAGKDVIVFLATGAVDVSVFVARITVRILAGYIAYMRGE